MAVTLQTAPDCITPANSAPAPLAERQKAAQIAGSHRRVWERKPVLREVYADFFARMKSFMATIPGPAIELGGGPGLLKAHIPDVFSSDIAGAAWLDLATDAQALPLADASVANLLLVDVLHHLSRPQRFLMEATRVLKPGGRVVILDVFLSPLSWPVFHFLHPEPATLSIRPLDHQKDEPLFDADDPWNSDQGMCRALFWKQGKQFNRMNPALKIVHRECFSTVLWPLSGGFEQKDRIPTLALPLLRQLDRALEKLGRLTGFRCLVALERVPDEEARQPS
jgi:SAM-dependent methyltransferase